MLSISNVPGGSVAEALNDISLIIGSKMPDDRTIDIMVEQLKKYHGNITLHDLKLAVEFNINSITKVDERPYMKLPYLASCIKAYRNHKRQTDPQEEKEPTLEERYGKTRAQMNEEICEGFINMIEKYKQDRQTYIYTFYVQWFNEIGFDLWNYVEPEEVYLERIKETHYPKFTGIYGDVNTLETKVLGKDQAVAHRLALTDFINYCVDKYSDLNEVKSLILN